MKKISNGIFWSGNPLWVRKAAKKNVFFWDIFPKCGWVGWLIPKQGPIVLALINFRHRPEGPEHPTGGVGGAHGGRQGHQDGRQDGHQEHL